MRNDTIAAPRHDEAVARLAASRARLLHGGPEDFDPLMDLVADARCVLIGEATHGTHDFYRLRAQLTRRLIEERGFCAVAAEADWPDAYRVSRYVRGMGTDADAVDALTDFRRFPSWMWRNADVLDFVGWLRSHNEPLSPTARVGFYGLDLYSLHASIGAVLRYLDRVDPEAARRARYRYACFEHFGEDEQAYGHATSLGLRADCEHEVIEQLLDMQRRRADQLKRDGVILEDEQFEAEQNARVVKSAEEYYRTMMSGRVSSWNLRDTHMADTLEQLLTHLQGRFVNPKVVLWAHNSHVGNARATEMGESGELNIGQLVRERHPRHTILVGFTTHRGTVTAASDWGSPAERMRVRQALPGSCEDVLHRTGIANFMLTLVDDGELRDMIDEPRLQRAIGVVYRPETERRSHHFRTRLVRQFDAVIHVDETRAVEPLERNAGWDRTETPETYPTGI